MAPIINRSRVIDSINTLFGRSEYASRLSTVLPSILDAVNVSEEIRNQNTIPASTKSDASPVTIADICSQILICKCIRENYPNDLIIAEEDESSLNSSGFNESGVLTWLSAYGISSTLQASRYLQRMPLPTAKINGPPHTNFWTIDPIDGTKGYVRGGQYSICVAYIAHDQVQMAILACPLLPVSEMKNNQAGTLFLAINGYGAYEVPLSGAPIRKLLRPRRDKLENSVVCESFESSHSSHTTATNLVNAFGMNPDTVRVDSQCKYGLVARGDADIFLRQTIKQGYREKIWDHAPGILIVREAGGNVCNLLGANLKVSAAETLADCDGIIASFLDDSTLLNLTLYLKNLS